MIACENKILETGNRNKKCVGGKKARLPTAVEGGSGLSATDIFFCTLDLKINRKIVETK